MAKLKLTVACGDYAIVRPPVAGTVQADGIEPIAAAARPTAKMSKRRYDIAINRAA